MTAFLLEFLGNYVITFFQGLKTRGFGRFRELMPDIAIESAA